MNIFPFIDLMRYRKLDVNDNHFLCPFIKILSTCLIMSKNVTRYCYQEIIGILDKLLEAFNMFYTKCSIIIIYTNSGINIVSFIYVYVRR